MLVGWDKTLRFPFNANYYLKIFKQNKKTPWHPTPPPPPKPNHPQRFCHCCSEVFECIYLHFHQQKTTDGSVPVGRAAQSPWNISLQLPVCAHISQQFQKGCLWSDTPFFFPLIAFPLCLYVWTVLSVYILRFFHWCSLLCGAGLSRAGWRELCGWVLALCSLWPEILFETFAFCRITGSLPLGIFPLLEC